MWGRSFKNLFVGFFVWAVVFIGLIQPSDMNQSKEGKKLLYKLINLFPYTANAASGSVDRIPRWPHQKSDLFSDPTIIYGKLPNGFRYVLIENHEPKQRVSMHLNIQAGSMSEGDYEQGLAHFLEHMLFNGSTHFKPGELIKYFQSIGMQFGPDANAHTGFYETVYDVLLPEGDIENLKKGLVVLKDYAQGAFLLQSEIDRERKVVLAEKRTRDSASYRTFVSTLKFELPDTRIPKRLPIGKENIIKKADRGLLKKFYDTWYRPENMLIVMAGDFNPDTAVSLIKENFSSISARAPRKSNVGIGKIDHKGIKPFYHFEKEAGNTTVSIEVLRKTDRTNDSFALQKKWLLKNIADRIVQDRLDAIVGKPGTPFTSAAISSGIYLEQIEYATITADCSPEKWKEALSVIEQTLRQAAEHGFTKSELERVKRDFLSGLDNAVKKASTRNSRALARSIINSVNNNIVFQSPDQEKVLFAPVIRLATLNDIHESFKKTWEPEHRLVLITGNARISSTKKDPKDIILSIFNKSRSVKVLPSAEKKPVTFPYLPEPDKKGRIVAKTRIDDLKIVQVDFENGVRLNLKKTDFKADEVKVLLAFGSGRSAEPSDKAGLAALSEAVINESGFGSLKKDDVERALAGKNTDVFFEIDEDKFSFNGTTVTKEIKLLFQLLYAHIVDPGYRENAYTLSIKRLEQKYKALSSSIDGAMMLSGRRFLAGGDSRFGLPLFDELKELTLKDIRSWIDGPLKHSRLEMSVVGDFDINLVIETASKYLGSLPARKEHKLVKRLDLLKFPVAQSLKIEVPTKINKGIVIVAYPSEDLWDIKRTRRLSVLAEIFSDRLRENIREKLGAAYSVFAFNSPKRAYPGYGVFFSMAYIDPKQVTLIESQIRKIASDISKNGVTQEELKRALNPTLSSIKEMLGKNTYWLHTVLSQSISYPQQLQWNRTILNDYASIKADEVSAFAKKYLNNDKAATIIIKPENKK
ncbi:MAG: insulinase family protein [Deltaproteobacteria bacterium]|nr:insulinase family protein [Deltaproteobacteria bacterium]